MLDRFDLMVEAPALTSDELPLATPAEPSAAVRERVLTARACQQARGDLNARLPDVVLHRVCGLDGAAHRLIANAVDRGGMSARGVQRALRVARTIADLAAEERVTALRLAEAIQHRACEAHRFEAQA